MIKLPRRPKLEGDARIEYGIINLMQNKGYYNCRLVKTLKNGAKVFQMMDKNDHPCSCIWAQADEENWMKVSEIATKDEATMTFMSLVWKPKKRSRTHRKVCGL